MKKTTFFALLLCFAVASCVKTNDDGNNPSPAPTTLNTANYSALIVGKWQFTELGGVSGHVCTEDPTHNETVWSKMPNGELLEFKTTGEFMKSWNNDRSCQGSFDITNGQFVTKSACLVATNITELTQTTLIFDTNNKVTRYKYERVK